MFGHLIKAIGVLMLVVLLQFVAVPPFASATSGTLTITTSTTLIENHVGNIVIAADNITLDCAHFSVIGPGASDTAGIGILLVSRTGVTVKNCNVAGFKFGVLLSGSSHNTFQSNNANSNFHDGICLGCAILIGAPIPASSSNRFISNTANNNRRGVEVTSSSGGNTLMDNVANGNIDFGFIVSSTSNGNFLKDNTANNEPTGFAVFDSTGNTLVDNKGNADLPGGAFFIAGGGTNTVTDNTATNSNVGFQVSSSTGNIVANNFATGNFFGFAFTQTPTTGNMISGNTANGNIAFITPSGQILAGDGFLIVAGPTGNTFTQNSACGNATIDAFQAIPGSNTFIANSFCTTVGIP